MKDRVGVWLIGARGGIATTLAYGLAGLRLGLHQPVGLVTSLPFLEKLDLAPLEGLVLGGHEVRQGSLPVAGEELVRARILSPRLLEEGKDAVAEMERNIVPGVCNGAEKKLGVLEGEILDRDQKHPAEIVDELRGHLADFRSRHNLSTLVVVNLASTEAHAELSPAWQSLEGLMASLRGGEKIPASLLYAFAAFQEKCPYINFTPSLGNSPMGMQELARESGVAHCGRDGKTGETLLKTVLAPLFAARNLRVLSWEGYNLLGNRDGEALSDPASRKAKIQSKDESLRKILDNPSMHTNVSIDYVPSLGDWKTAWDFIHFQGFLDVPMTLQFTWQGSDSALAAPLVLDLIRLAELAQRRGEVGLMPHTASFFKSPLGCDFQDFPRQFRLLEDYAAGRPSTR